jgi:hypothetical protein
MRGPRRLPFTVEAKAVGKSILEKDSDSASVRHETVRANAVILQFSGQRGGSVL